MKRIVQFSIVIVFAIAGCHQQPTPLVDIHGEPTAIGIKCPSGIVCDRRSEVCGEVGHACGPKDCCYIGDDGRAFASKRARDAGRE